jgi:hypothetical protein
MKVRQQLLFKMFFIQKYMKIIFIYLFIKNYILYQYIKIIIKKTLKIILKKHLKIIKYNFNHEKQPSCFTLTRASGSRKEVIKSSIVRTIVTISRATNSQT